MEQKVTTAPTGNKDAETKINEAMKELSVNLREKLASIEAGIISVICRYFLCVHDGPRMR